VEKTLANEVEVAKKENEEGKETKKTTKTKS